MKYSIQKRKSLFVDIHSIGS